MNSMMPAPTLERNNLRYTLRYAGSELSRLSFHLKQQGNENPIPAQVYDFTYRGFAIRLRSGFPESLRPQIGETVDLIFNRTESGVHPWSFSCTVAHIQIDAEGCPMLGLRRIFSRKNQAGLMEMRQSPRIHLPSSLGLTATSPHPLLYGHQTKLRMVDINLGMGYCLETLDPLFLVSEGCILAIHFSMPGYTGSQVMAKVTWVQPVDKQRIRIGIQTLDMPFELYHSICRLLLTSQIVSPGVLREAGFYVRHVREDIRFRQANRLEEYAEVLKLRRESLMQGMPDLAGIRCENMALESDAHSRILVAWHADRLIGSMTLYFPQTLNATSDLSECVHQGKDSFPLPILTECIEMRQLCVTDDFRGTDVLQGLIEQAMKAFLLSDRLWFLVAVQAEQSDFYRQMGFKDRGVSHHLTFIHGTEIHILSMHRDDVLGGQGISVWIWNLSYGDLARYILRRNLIPISILVRMRMHLKLTFNPLAQFFYGQKLRHAYQKHLLELRKPLIKQGELKKANQDWSAVP